MIEKIQKYKEKKEKISEKLCFRILNQLLNVLLAVATVIPLLYKVCTSIPFTFEVNDDSVLQLILDGSYTGNPDAHAIFIKYPLSWIISTLYRLDQANPFSSHLKSSIWSHILHADSLEKLAQTGLIRATSGGTLAWGDAFHINWYLTTMVLLTGFAMVVVLYRMLYSIRCNRFLLCGIYALGFIYIWLPCFSQMTFSTVAAFQGCMALLYLGLTEKEDLWKPWNLLILAILITSAFGWRRSCFLMVLPCLILEIVFKYHIHFFKSWKPWLVVCVLLLTYGGITYCDRLGNGSAEWKDYFAYNHARAYMQDYEGFPDYEENKGFYQAQGISKEEWNTIKSYSYCLVDDFRPDWINEIYAYKKSQEVEKTWKEKIEGAKDKAMSYALESKQAPRNLRFFSFYLWGVLLLFIPVTLILRCRDGFLLHLWYTLESIAFAGIVAAEFIYLAINGRYPARVEESIRLLMLTTALLMICHFLRSYQEIWMCRLHGILQIILIVAVFTTFFGRFATTWSDVQTKQMSRQSSKTEKGEILEYCSQHPDNFYVLETRSFLDGSLPSDHTDSMNWIMSGSWIAYSPLYQEKLAGLGTDSIGGDFLKKDHVYIITDGPEHIEKLMGLEKGAVEYEIVDEFYSSKNQIYEIYQVR